MSEPDADEIWNRACDPFRPFTHPGDGALAAGGAEVTDRASGARSVRPIDDLLSELVGA